MMINIHVMNIIFINTWAAEAGISSQKVFINDDADNAYYNVMMLMMKIFWWWYDHDRDDEDNYDPVDDNVDDNDMMIWF